MTTSLFILEHRPYDPLSDRWVVVSAGRTDRPWPGDEEPGTAGDLPVDLW